MVGLVSRISFCAWLGLIPDEEMCLREDPSLYCCY